LAGKSAEMQLPKNGSAIRIMRSAAEEIAIRLPRHVETPYCCIESIGAREGDLKMRPLDPTAQEEDDASLRKVSSPMRGHDGLTVLEAFSWPFSPSP
jgi:hypothetical protein